MKRRDAVLFWGVLVGAVSWLVLLAAFLLGPIFAPLMHRRRAVVEQLADPVPVRTVTADALVLADGRSWGLSISIPEQAAELFAAAVRGGVELDGAGRAFGLIRVHHWCGNDPISEHIARIDLEQLVRFARNEERLTYGRYGWDVSQYHACFGWEEYGE